MKDGAHTHHGHGSDGLGLVVSIAAGLVLASVIQRLLPVLLIGLAVVAGLAVLGLITYAVSSSCVPHELLPAGPAGRPPLQAASDEQTQVAATPITRVAVPAAQHQHLHFHGLDVTQVAAILALQHDQAAEEGDAW